LLKFQPNGMNERREIVVSRYLDGPLLTCDGIYMFMKPRTYFGDHPDISTALPVVVITIK